MTEFEATKRGATFAATIAVTINGNPQDLTAAGWIVEAQARTTADATDAVDFTINQADLAGSEVTLELSAADTLAMTVGSYLVDVRIEDPTGTVYLSPTYEMPIEASITQEATA